MSLCLSPDDTRIETPYTALTPDTLGARLRRLFLSAADQDTAELMPAPRVERSAFRKPTPGRPAREEINALLL
ncbi:hypothetical protein [Aureimonas phyllosphaerae]|uniref:Uncharacterized protein n=1 Tax=Aureimonas phyllosphaerae TaxID=1166078 RepID=A0A7W6FVT9_9HYPH|nr:hypothetical protein [Aureimonas phyllosphaerae]MBB3937185.1 hypothetical protein [Aureimonas phyllosphaerae]MBB3961178.1 hypothetical protein [Aureimonas phyllosphaerae]SFF48724.1 hypothetical protein SAMN05216566_11713 [Aureimonas phyllosphaerae]